MIWELASSTLRMSVPLIFAAMGGLLCERAGVATICLEGVMLIGAWTAAVVNLETGNPWLGLFAGVFAGAMLMALHAWLSITTKADQIISGVAVNLVASGITPMLNKALFGSSTNTPSIPMADRFGSFLGILPLTWLALFLPVILYFAVTKTRWGLRLLAAGDGPNALEAAGVRVSAVRWRALLLGGGIAAMGGVFLSISHASQFTREMTAGRGYIALTALIFGKWKPLPTLASCFLFGFADAMQIRLQSTTLLGYAFPVQFVQGMPYLVTLLVLVAFVGRARPPLAIGQG